MICLTFLGFFPSTNSSKMVARDVFLLGRRVYLIFRPSVSEYSVGRKEESWYVGKTIVISSVFIFPMVRFAQR